MLKCETCKTEGDEEEIKQRWLTHPILGVQMKSNSLLCKNCAHNMQNMFNQMKKDDPANPRTEESN